MAGILESYCQLEHVSFMAINGSDREEIDKILADDRLRALSERVTITFAAAPPYV